MADRSSTRTHHSSAQHHSRSQWSLGWGDEEKAPAVSSNAFASGANMNAGNVISAPSQHQQPPMQRPEQVTAAPRVEQAPEPVPIVDKTNIATTAPAPGIEKGNVSSNAFASGSNMNAGNFITDRPTTRVHAPPGGRSQITFG
ncbi:Protein SPIRAL1 [Hondaea fermentalgiana]|uniref:Protein SPIRAL1 n=1 Tax=Hondaea fermentalgiana TaxID=2315210 RepID=A0A2R5GBR3_9STRA|nr:Protein SPIRAL1 [Hondaea fermentalgiana]|eukprot:GBG28436.1 Protein SPIRAL1 [Hondaea fermentalgiana]